MGLIVLAFIGGLYAVAAFQEAGAGRIWSARFHAGASIAIFYWTLLML